MKVRLLNDANYGIQGVQFPVEVEAEEIVSGIAFISGETIKNLPGRADNKRDKEDPWDPDFNYAFPVWLGSWEPIE